MMINLLEQVIHLLVHNGKSSLDVLWVGGTIRNEHGYQIQYRFSWEEFKALAQDCWDTYFPGNPGIKIVGDRWWIESDLTSDGEDWVFRRIPGWEYSEMLPCHYPPEEQKSLIERMVGCPAGGNLAEVLQDDRDYSLD